MILPWKMILRDQDDKHMGEIESPHLPRIGERIILLSLGGGKASFWRVTDVSNCYDESCSWISVILHVKRADEDPGKFRAETFIPKAFAT